MTAAQKNDDADIDRAYRVVEALCHIPGRRAEKPTVFFVVGQQGAGKSVAIKHLIKNLPRDEAVTILDQDSAAARAPNFRENARLHGYAEAENRSKGFMRKCISNLANLGIASRSHVIIEVADPNVPIEPIIKSFALNAKYRSELVVLAVPDVVSQQNLAMRYEHEVESKGYGRAVGRADHDQAYRKWPARIAGLLIQDLFDKVSVVEPRRGPDVGKPPATYSVREKIVENDFVSEQTVGLKPLSALITLRSGGLTQANRQAFDKRWKDLAAAHPQRAPTYEQDRENAGSLLRQAPQIRFNRELVMAMDGANGLRSDLQIAGVKEKIESLAHGVKRVEKQPLAIDPFPLLASLRITKDPATIRRAAPQAVTPGGDRIIAARKRPGLRGPRRESGIAY